jgi:hypothetical protein
MDQEKIDILAAVTQNGYALRLASVELRANKEVVLPAVTQNGYALDFASIELRADKEVVLAAVIQDGYALLFASDELKNDEYFLWEVNQICKIEVNSNIFYYISKRIQDEIKENLDYLLDFEPIYLKPCKK